tara:strand:+ start:134 stop:292 length:159 start_codon:yes stop_codon:yes gene_type:complete
MNSKPIAIGLVFGVGLALALKSWLLGIMFGIFFFVAINNSEKKEYYLSDEEE